MPKHQHNGLPVIVCSGCFCDTWFPPMFTGRTINKPQTRVYNIAVLTFAGSLVCKSGQPAVPEVWCTAIMTTSFSSFIHSGSGKAVVALPGVTAQPL